MQQPCKNYNLKVEIFGLGFVMSSVAAIFGHCRFMMLNTTL